MTVQSFITIKWQGKKLSMINIFKFFVMSSLTSALLSRGDRWNAMASTVEDGRENSFSLLEDSDVEEATIVVDSDNETDTYQTLDTTKRYYF